MLLLLKRPIIQAILLLSLISFVCSRDIPSSEEEEEADLNSAAEVTESVANKSSSSSTTTTEAYEDSFSLSESEEPKEYQDSYEYSEEPNTPKKFPEGIQNYFTSSITIIKIFLYIQSVSNIDETVGTVTLDFDMEIKWRLNGFQNVTNLWVAPNEYIVEPKHFEKLWKPDINFNENVNLANQSLLRKPLRLTYDTSGHSVSYITRDSVKLNCAMDFQYYPADTQRCNFTIRSYTYDRKTFLMWRCTHECDWFGLKTLNLTDSDFEVQVESTSRKLRLSQLNKNVKGGHYQGLIVTLAARRKISYHIVQTYLPSILYILITCLCFLVPSHMVEVRMGISMTTLLTLTAMFSSVRESSPSVSYVKAIDIWMAFCIFFVFLTLLEFTTLLWFRHKREAAEKKRLENQKMLQALESVIGGKCLIAPVCTNRRNFAMEPIHYKNHEKFSEAVEKYGLFVFSLGFGSFIIIYWTWLIMESGYSTWKINKKYLEH